VNTPRRPSEGEKALLAALLERQPRARAIALDLDNLLVQEMRDGGMGSLSLIPQGLECASRQFGEQLILAEFIDTDGIPVSVALNVDKKGMLYELDMWKVNFAPITRWPAPSEIKVIEA
jgi:hypothetical protein